MRVAKWVVGVVVAAVVVGCFIVNAGVTALVLGGVVLVGAAYLYFVHFGRPRRASRLDTMPVGSWRTVELGPRTMSADGSPYALYVRRGGSANLVIHFSGGGACWDGETASRPITLLRMLRGYTRRLTAFYFAALSRLFPAALTGLANRRDPKNPFRDWTFVFIPYTTGDMHVGDTVATYAHDGRELRVHHNGRSNVTTALAWVFENCRDVGTVLVSGESSGAWASAFYAPTVADHYEGARVCCLSDGAGIVSPRWPELFDRVWQADTAERLGFRVGDDVYRDALLHRVDARRRNITYLHANTLYDDTLPRFAAALDGRPTTTDAFIDEWASTTAETMRSLEESGLDYRFFLTDWGHDPRRHTTAHTLTTNELFHACEAEGVAYSEWLARNVIHGERVSLGTELVRRARAT